jgi:peptidoglycan/xylan/chitin deacetylase (PgdA/CDA1 family)
MGSMRQVTLTFDNGPTKGVTEEVLDILARQGLRSTFFVVGRKLVEPGAADLMHAAHAAEHWIGNHTLTHSIPFGELPTAEFAATEIGGTEALIGTCARPEKLFRPYGRQGAVGPHVFSRAAVGYLLEHRYRAVLWNSVPGDWKDADGWVDRCLAQVQAQDWSVVVLHDIANACLPRLPELLSRLRDIGVVFEQDFPDSVVLTQGGRIVSLDPAHVIDL